jgi:hypothetical protein
MKRLPFLLAHLNWMPSIQARISASFNWKLIKKMLGIFTVGYIFAAPCAPLILALNGACCSQGCQIFLRLKYPNGKIYQIIIKYTKRHKMYKMDPQ